MNLRNFRCIASGIRSSNQGPPYLLHSDPCASKDTSLTQQAEQAAEINSSPFTETIGALCSWWYLLTGVNIAVRPINSRVFIVIIIVIFGTVTAFQLTNDAGKVDWYAIILLLTAHWYLHWTWLNCRPGLDSLSKSNDRIKANLAPLRIKNASVHGT